MRRLAAVLVVSMTLPALAPPAPAAASPGSGPTAIVSLGDSFISGEGGRWLGNAVSLLGTRSGTDRAAYGCGSWGACAHDPHLVYGHSEDSGCHRSDVAPLLSAPIGVAVKANLACSGAQAENIWRAAAGGEWLRGEPPQADRLAGLARGHDVRLVVLTVGANNAGFGTLVLRCAVDWARSSEQAPSLCRRAAQDALEADLPAVARGVRKALAEIRAAMSEAGYDRDSYRLVAMGYASPFPAGRWIRYPQWGWSRLRQGGCPLWDADADWALSEATPAIDAALRRAAAGAEAEFLDLQHAFDGHQLCDRRDRLAGAAGPSAVESEWFRRLGFAPGSLRESLHPNAYGQRAIGACLGLLYAATPGGYACKGTPGQSYVDGMRLLPLR
ncbi:MAG TPA: GDSL-type esterase/lipase family protein [Solirubrobacterales bacterium]|nr:GDSL-type esterase/lipase family protein [Solirubrobacterales bacterium]